VIIVQNNFLSTIFPNKNWLIKGVISATMLAGAIGGQANAQAFTLAPTRLILEGSARSQELTIINGTDKVQTYRLRLEDRRVTETGDFEVVTDPAAPFIGSPMLRLSARQFTVQPQESATVRVLLRKPAGLAAGEYRSHLIVTELPSVGEPTVDSTTSDGIAIRITPIFAISVPVIVRTGEVSARLAVSDVVRKAVPDSPNLDTISLRLTTIGNRSMFVDIRIVDARRRRGDPIFLNKAVAIYSPTNSRLFQLSLNAEQTARVRAGGVILQYQEVNKDGGFIGPATEIAF
jgi:Pili and flagellar-assembly chaperone, PapD N-terminal domain